MSNRLLSFLVLSVILGGIFWIYYYFFVLSTASVSLIINGSGSTSVLLTSEFQKSYSRECERSCLFADIPAVNYTVSAKRGGYLPLEKTFDLHRGEAKKVVIIMEKEVTLSEQKKKKEEVIAAIKLKNTLQETMETNTGWIILGYRTSRLYYALPSPTGWDVFVKKEDDDAGKSFKIPKGILTTESLDTYEGYIALEKKEGISFYSITDGAQRDFDFTGKILSIKDTLDEDTKIIKSDIWVFMYTVSEKISRENPLYDDIIQLPTGEIVVLIKKTSKSKQSLLSLTDTNNDYIFLIAPDTRVRKTLLKTPKNGKLLHYKNGEILFIDEEWGTFVVGNVK